MGLFSRGPEKVIRDGGRVRGRIVAIAVDETSVNDSIRRVDEYVIELSPADGGRRLGLRQDLVPDTHVRFGMEVAAWVRGDDIYVDWTATMAEQGVEGQNMMDGWKGERDARRVDITDSQVGAAQALKKGERASMMITELRWDSKFGGLVNTLTIVGVVSTGTAQPYAVEVGRQTIPHYATHLPSVGRQVPVIVSAKRPDKVTIDWPAAALAEPGVGVAPSTEIAAARVESHSVMSMGGEAMGGTDVAWTPPPPPSGFVPPSPVEGVTWEQYLTIEKAIADSGGYGRQTAALVESHGVSFATYTKASTAFGKMLVRDAALQQSFVAAMQ